MSDTTDLTTACAETLELLPRLAELIPEPTNTANDDTPRGKRVHAPLPWNEPAAGLYYEIHADARTFERNLTLRLFKRATYRPGTDDHTREVITRLPDLIAHAHDCGLDPKADQLDTMTRTILRWPVQVRAILDEARPDETPWTRAPGNLVCPYCDRALWLSPGWQKAQGQVDVICRTCHDDTGALRRWAPNAWLARLQEDPTPDTHISAADAETEYGLSKDQVYVWHHREPFTDLSEDKYARRLYPRDQIEARIARRRGVSA